jgi:DNA gyrase subunit A
MEYSLYTIQDRAIPHLADGLKMAHRRVIWLAKDGAKYKSATLAGATMCIHPHGAPEGSINTLTAPFSNNIPLFTALSTFGTKLAPDSFGAARYTSVKLSPFTKDIILKDIEIIPMQLSYDDSEYEPIHYLPLVPVVLINPQSGIAVGFACDILPRSLADIVTSQLKYLKSNEIVESYPKFLPTEQYAIDKTFDKKSNNPKWTFVGQYERYGVAKVFITELPYGVKYTDYVDHLIKLVEDDKIIDYEDESKSNIHIVVKFDKKILSELSEDQLLKLLKLVNIKTENLNVVNFDGITILHTDYLDIIKKFTDWRLTWYVQRYERLLSKLREDIQRYKDIIKSIEKNVGSVARKTSTRDELIQYLLAIKIVYTDYIAQLPVYRFTVEEKEKTEKKLAESLVIEQSYIDLLNDENKRRAVYISELEEVFNNYCKGKK